MNNSVSICDISPFYELINLENEWCGFFEYEYEVNNNNNYSQCIKISDINLTEGENIDNRKACRHPYYEKMIWHTHPVTSKPYPSREDVLKVLKHQIIDVSVIATRWGVWQIKYLNFIPMNETDIKREKKIINEFEKIIYENTRRARKERLNSSDMWFIHEYIRKLQNQYPGLNIRFDRWEDLYNNNLFISL